MIIHPTLTFQPPKLQKNSPIGVVLYSMRNSVEVFFLLQVNSKMSWVPFKSRM
jgi:hypothetical protein